MKEDVNPPSYFEALNHHDFLEKIYSIPNYRRLMPAPFEVEFKLRRKFKTLLKNKLDQTKSGINEDAMGSNADNAKKFQNITKEIFDFLFDKSQIAEGKLEIRNHSGENRRDILFDISMCREYCFRDFLKNFNSTHILCECKNTKEVSEFKKGIDQICRYTDTGSFGTFAIFVVRNKKEMKDQQNFWARQNDRFILLLDDNDLKNLLDENVEQHPFLYNSSEETKMKWLLNSTGANLILKKCMEQKTEF